MHPRAALVALPLLAALAAGAAVLAPAAARAQAPAATAAADGFDVPVALFVREPAAGYGMYAARPSRAFSGDEPLFFYLEPRGFGYAREGGLNRFGAVVDLRITENGKPVFEKDAFLNASFTSHHENREINFSGRLTVSGAPKGEYALELLVRDAVSERTAKVELPFSIE